MLLGGSGIICMTLTYIRHASWIGSVLYRSCTTSHITARALSTYLESKVDNLPGTADRAPDVCVQHLPGPDGVYVRKAVKSDVPLLLRALLYYIRLTVETEQVREERKASV